MLYVVGIIIVAVGGSIVFGVLHISRESGPGERPSMDSARLAIRRSRIVASGSLCVCGGTLGDSTVMSQRFGPLLGCSGCDRFWTADGRRMVRRRVARDQRRAERPVRPGRK
jgi:hypothetical protein